MPSSNQQTDEAIEKCVDEIGDFFASLDEYPQIVLVTALRIHIEGLLQLLLEREECSREEAREFLHDMEQEVLGSRGD